MTKLKEFIKESCTGLDAIQRAPIVDCDTDLKCLRIQDLSQSKSYKNWGNTSANIEQVKLFLIRKNDNFIARTGSTIGCNIFFSKDLKSVFNNGLIRLRTNNLMDAKYLHYLMLTKEFQTYIKGISMSSATQPNMKINDLLNYELRVPDISKQQHIVNTIGTLDDLIEKYNEILLKIKKQRIKMYDYFSSLAEKDDDFLNHVKFENGAQPPKEMHIYEPQDGYVRFIQNRDYDSNNYLTYIPVSRKNHLCKEDDIMMDKYGDAGAVRYGIAGAYNVALLKIIPVKNSEEEYIRDFLSQENIKNILYQSSQASTRPSLNESTFKGIRMPVLNDVTLSSYQDKLAQLLKYELIIKNKINLLHSSKAKLLEKYF